MKPSFIKYTVTVALCFIYISLTAQTQLKGKVADFLTFAPIESASIYVQNTTTGTVSNADGKFALVVPNEYVKDTLIISSIGYKSFKVPISDFNPAEDIYLEEDIASLDEVVLVAETRPKTGNDIVLRAIEELPETLPEKPFLQKGFLRHKERNKKEYKWLIESALTFYDETDTLAGKRKKVKVNVDETRKSYDLRDVDSLYAYAAYLNNKSSNNSRLRSKNLRRDTIKTRSLVKAIKWNDTRINGIDNLMNGKLNLIRNSNVRSAILGEKMLEQHQFLLDTVLVDEGRKVYKVKILKGQDYVGLNSKNIYNEGFEAKGWLYIYWDTFAFKRIEYELIAASEVQRRRSKSLFDTDINHKLIITYKEFEDKMYPNYIYYETPKLVNVGERSSIQEKRDAVNKDEQFYYTVQEILFTEIIFDPEIVDQTIKDKEWIGDIFSIRPYNDAFWKNYNVLLESEEEEKLVEDLSKRATLFKQ